MGDKYSPLHVLAACFIISSIAGIASELRVKGAISVRQVISAALYSGVLGLVIGLLWYQYWSETNVYFLIGVSGLAGLGGMSLVDIILNVISKLYSKGVKVHFEFDEENKSEK